MSLKTFHIIFIVFSVLISLFFGYWAVNTYAQNNHVGYLAAFFGALISSIALITYGMNVYQKLKDI